MGCDRVRELVAELAIGIADGRERDAAMRHAVTCPDCRQLVCELSAVVDDLLLLAPSHEPPPGFTAETVARIFPPSPGFTAETVARIFPQPAARHRRVSWPAARHVLPNRRWLPRLAAAASIVAALALGAGAVYQGTSSDRQLAASYRAVLAQGHGSFFAVAPLKSPTGTLGSVFGYQGQPSWLFATLNRPAAQPEHYDVQLITRDGRHLSLGETVLGGTHSTWGGKIPVKLTQVSQLRFEAASGQATMVADFSPHSPWSPG